MAAECYSNPSVASSLCIHLLVYDEMRFYLTCKAMYRQSYARREWWAQVRDIDGLAFHTTPGVGQRSWNCYTTWHYCTANGTFLDPPEEAIVATPSPDESALTAPASDTSSTSEIPDSEMEIFMPHVYDQMLYLPLVDLAWDSPQLEGAAPRSGPLCEHCGLLTCVGRSEIKGLVCARCLQGECIDQWIGYWSSLHRNNEVLSDPTFARHIIEYMYGNGLSAYCYCGQCNPDWFLHGWICRPYSDARAVPYPDSNNLAWKRSARTPEWVVEESL